MFAGKSTELFAMIECAEHYSQKVLVVTSALDTRAGARSIATHAGLQRSAIAVKRLHELVESAEWRGAYHDCDLVAIDEGQFFVDLHDFVLKAVEEHGKDVVAAGLSGDYRRNAFGDMTALVPFADRITFQCARCSVCEAPAAFTMRTVGNKGQILVGGGDAYRPVCRKHYLCPETLEVVGANGG